MRALHLAGLFGIAAAACGLPDESIDLLPAAGATGGAGGVSSGGAGGTPPAVGGGCSANVDCDSPRPSCDLTTGECIACLAGLTACDDDCVDWDSDPRHCGGCDSPCGHNEVCHLGTCRCLPGLTHCDGGCRDLSSDVDFCGDCTVHCDPQHKCEQGQCLAGTCAVAGLSACPSSNERVACVDLARGYPFCGTCGTTCAVDEACVDGTCARYQPATPCLSCPCAAICTPTFGTGAQCCEAPFGETFTACVDANACP